MARCQVTDRCTRQALARIYVAGVLADQGPSANTCRLHAAILIAQCLDVSLDVRVGKAI